jgi:hypothetical protein
MMLMPAVAGCTAALKKPPPPTPEPLVITHDNTVIDGGRYESISVEGADNVTIRNAVVDNSGYGGDPLQAGADCFYVKGVGNVTVEDSRCLNPHRQGAAIISTQLGASVVFDDVLLDPHRYTFDLEPNTTTQKISEVRILNTTSTEGFGWLMKPCDGVVESLYAFNNSYDGRAMPDGYLPCGRY